MTITSLAARAASVVAQLLLARLLAKSDFGIYAAALGVAGFVTAFRDAGVSIYLVRYGLRDYKRLAAPVFWLAMAVNVAGGVVLAGIGLYFQFGPGSGGAVEGSTLHDPRFPAMLYVIALSMPLGTPSSVLRTKMRLDLQFKQLSLMGFSSAMLRYVGSVLLALAGVGAMSFVLPMLAIAVLEWVWSQVCTRDRSWWGRPALSTWPEMIRETKWLLLGTLGSVVYNMGAYFAVAYFVPAAVVGVYFFAYQMTQQVCALITANLQQVLAPVLVHLDEHTERLRLAGVRTLRVLSAFSVPLMLGMGVVIDPLERLILGGAWREAVLPIIAFGALTPMALTWGLTYSIYTSKGRFQAWAWWSLAEGAVVTVAAVAAAAVWGSALSISLATAVAMMLTRFAMTIAAMGLLGVRPREVIIECTAPWAIGLAAGAVSMWAATEAAPGTGVASDIIKFVLAGTLFCGLYAVGLRVLQPRTVRESMSMVPAKFRPMASNIMLMRA